MIANLLVLPAGYLEDSVTYIVCDVVARLVMFVVMVLPLFKVLMKRVSPIVACLLSSYVVGMMVSSVKLQNTYLFVWWAVSVPVIAVAFWLGCLAEARARREKAQSDEAGGEAPHS